MEKESGSSNGLKWDLLAAALTAAALVAAAISEYQKGNQKEE